MISMTLTEIAAIVGGAVVHDTGASVTGAAFLDSRVAERDGLFVAVAGERADGHDYADAAVAAGAAAILSARDTGQPGVVVEDPIVALALLARHSLSRLDAVKVVALTGSQGKTSTKDLLAQVLATAGTTVATFGSFNNELGLPLTVLRAAPTTEFLVLEMGARHVGDIRASCEVAPPDVALVLNVGKAHIGEFGSREAIASAKGEIVEALTGDGVAVLNADDELVAAMAGRAAGQVRTFGSAEGTDVRFGDLVLDDLGRPAFLLHADGETARVTMGLVGEHHAGNATAAATATSPGRMQVRESADGVTVIDDAYNANPDSMRAALKALASIGRGRPGSRTVAVLGEMRELGAVTQAEHDAVGRLAVRLDIHQLVVVGEPARAMHLGALLEGSWGEESVFVPDAAAAEAWLADHLRPGDVVLFKASNAVQLSRLAEVVAARPLSTSTGERSSR